MKIKKQLVLYSFCHLVVDLVCVAFVLSSQKLSLVTDEQYWWLIVIYNTLAFGTQVGWGIILDWWQKPKNAVMISLLIILVGLLVVRIDVYAMVILLGFGNAWFHVGAGSWVLNVAEKEAAKPGIFVAPGALGLFGGILLAKTDWNFFGILTLLIGFCLLLVFLAGKSENHYQTKLYQINFRLEWIVWLILLTVQLRSLIGMILVFPWKSSFIWLAVSVVGVVLGKTLGGILGDKFGWTKIGVGSLLVSILLLTWGASNPVLAILGLFLFNFTMPITLIVLSNILPGRPGLAFGLTCFALWLGILPTVLGLDKLLNKGWIEGGLILLSAVGLFFGLKYYYLLKNNHGKMV